MKVNFDKIDWPRWPQYGQEEQDAVLRVIKSNQLFADKEVREFEESYSKYLGCKHALGIGNATEGLHLSLAALDIGIGDEVIVTPFSFISSASCVLMQNAVPVFCDIESESLGLCPNDIEKKISKRTKAIIVVHMFGYPARISEIMEVARKYNLYVVEDASHAHGASVDDIKIGTFGDISVFSMHQRKVLSVGDGGVVCTDRADLYEKIFKLRSFGHVELSYNYRMTEFAGALGKIQLSKLDEQNIIRRDNYVYLSEMLKDNRSLRVRSCRSNEYGVYYAIVIEVLNDYIDEIKVRVDYLKEVGVDIRETFVQPPLHKHLHFNPESDPARGAPWNHAEYDGVMQGGGDGKQLLNNAEKYCSPRILELYAHPPVNNKMIKKCADVINYVFNEDFYNGAFKL